MTIVILWCEVLLFDADDVMIITKSHMKSVTKVKFVSCSPRPLKVVSEHPPSPLPVYRLTIPTLEANVRRGAVTACFNLGAAGLDVRDPE